ncbi:MAG: DUF234 domain-containing protein [Sulfurovum sp.]|nr:DUF234 domain-containing protein [Sulfurovum sp.]
MEIEPLVEYFSVFGGLDTEIEIGYFDDILAVMDSHFVQSFAHYESLIRPSYLLESPYKELLCAIASGDGKFYSALRKAKLSEVAGEHIIEELIALNILSLEHSREAPLRVHPKHKLKKSQRAYKIQHKLRFNQPFLRFWFGFVAPYSKDLAQHKGTAFLQNFSQYSQRLRSLVFEQLCNALLLKHLNDTQHIISSGSYWNIHSEFDILAITSKKKIFLGECKYKDRNVCKNELSKLKQKAQASNIPVDTYVLFSKNGFSKELHAMKDKNVLLFDVGDLRGLI